VPRIVVLDGHALNPGDLDWEPLERLGSCVIHDRTPPEAILERSAQAELILTNKTPLTKATLHALPSLTYIGVLATGYNVVDIDAARALGIPVTNIPTYGTASVAQMVFAHILNIVTRTGDHARSVREGRWSRSPDWCYWDFPQVELQGLTLGIVGYGRIGRATAEIARAFGMKVVAHDVSTSPSAEGVEWTGIDDLFRNSDIVSLHCPLTASNHHLVNAQRLALMKPTAVLINTSRGLLVDEAALAEALDRGQIAAAGLDVLSHEPPHDNNPLLSARNCHITPHIAWATRAARSRLLATAVENASAFLAGKAVNVVNA
jgi:glycerate dehydrogenase